MSRGQRAGCVLLSLTLCHPELDAASNSIEGEKKEKKNGSKEDLQDSIQGQAGRDVQRKQGQRQSRWELKGPGYPGMAGFQGDRMIKRRG